MSYNSVFTLVVVYLFSLSVLVLDWWIIPLKSHAAEEVFEPVHRYTICSH
jgi:hypothetical protein